MEKVKNIYENYSEYNRLLRHKMEFYINLRYIKENLFNRNLKILDLGGGVGRYAIELTKVGHKVTLVDLAEKNIKDAKELCIKEDVELISIIQGDALNLSFLKESSFDVVLAMGPFYHLKKVAQREKCISEIKRVLKNKGTLFSAHLSRYAFFKFVVANMPEKIDFYYENFESIFDTGVKKYNDGDNFTDNTYCDNAEHILQFMENYGFKNSEIIASEGLVDNIEYKLQHLEEEKFEKVAELNYRICKNKHLLNGASHLLYKGIK